MFHRFLPAIAALMVTILTAGCATASPLPTPTEGVPPTTEPTQAPPTAEIFGAEETDAEDTPQEETMLTFASTLMGDGNRVFPGQGSFPEGVTAVDIILEGEPVWVVGAAVEDATLWVTVLENGAVQAFQVNGGGAQPIDIRPDVVPPGAPPLLVVDENGVPGLVTFPDGSPVSSAVPAAGGFAYVATTGEVVLVAGDGTEVGRLAVNALPDARILVDEADRLLLLTQPTQDYTHGVLGDDVEAGAVTLLQTSPTFEEVITIPVAGGVIEGIAPIWADLDGDGSREIIVTEANGSAGARIMAYNENGSLLAQGPAIGQGFRWRHQLASADFGAGLELAEVLTPHIGGVVGFYQLEGDQLSLTAQERGYTSHLIGSRNLDMAAAGDFNGDGVTELLIVNQNRSVLAAFQRNADLIEVVWTAPVDGRVLTNIYALPLPDGGFAVAVGHDANGLRVWLP